MVSNINPLTHPAGRELDALVAEKVMGWRWWIHYHTDSCRSLYVAQSSKNGYHKEWDGTHLAEDNRDFACAQEFTTDASADCVVLKHVVANWNREDRVSLDYWLSKLQEDRKGGDGRPLTDRMAYNPGDYSRAALAVVMEKENQQRKDG
jgi:hypothetical protein